MVLNGDMQHRAISLRLGKNYSIRLNMIHHCPKKSFLLVIINIEIKCLKIVT